ncbi:MAG: hypothetical protein P8M07_06990 [Flavobacteriales bacterium]|nr:hypothetical protein [Flavobacteriales bacterium]
MKRTVFFAFFVAALISTVSSGCKKGHLDRYGPFYVSSDTTVFYEGTSGGRVDDQFDRMIGDYPNIQSIVFSSRCPGSRDDESLYRAARKVRENGIKTILTSASTVESGAVDLFISGAVRTIDEGAKIGVHSWSFGGGQDGADLPADDEEHQMYFEFYAEMFQDEDLGLEFYWFTLESASGDDIHYMSQEEIDFFHLATE